MRYNALISVGRQKKLSGHYVRPQLGFHWTLVNFGWPLSDDRLLFAALWCRDQMVSTLDSRLSSPGSSPGRGHNVLCCILGQDMSYNLTLSLFSPVVHVLN